MNHSSRVSYLAAVIGQHARNRFAQLLFPLGITPQHFGVLRSIASKEGCTQQQVADLMDIRRNLLVGLIDDLEEAGLVVRGKHPCDRRANALQLTPLGKKILVKGNHAVDKVDHEVLDPLAPDQRAEFQDALQTIGAGLGLSPAVFPENQ